MTCALVILDGWGTAPPGPANAVTLARTPIWDALSDAPTSTLITSGEAVGLREGQMGNSNVGHLNIGAGRVVLSDLKRIDEAIRTGAFGENPVIREAAHAPRLHILSLFSRGGVHSDLAHLLAMLRERERAGRVEGTWLHLFTDGRDVPPRSALADLGELGSWQAHVASLSGRYYAMDRDQRWERTEKAYRAIAEARGRTFSSAGEAIRRSYDEGITDEFLVPAVHEGAKPSREDDLFFFMNFRADRARQLTLALTDPGFDAFPRRAGPHRLLTMTRYHDESTLPQAFPPERIQDTLGETVSRMGKTQWRVAETEKYAHVTYFLDGGRESAYPGEERVLVPSPKVATYDEAPQMSAHAVTDQAIRGIRAGCDLLVLNYANPDMVGHTGVIPAAVKAVETVDGELGRLLAELEKHEGMALVIADHGNAEMMIDPETGGPHTAHTTNPVTARLVGTHGYALKDGILADVAPTLLALMGVPQPPRMTGHSLLVNSRKGV